MAIFTIDLFRIVFEEFLKISPDLVSKYSTIQDQLIYLLLIPHLILLLFLFGFGYMIIVEHKGLRLLTTIVAYIFIIYSGWYGSFLVPLTITWFTIMLIFAFFLFFISKIFHPLQAQKLGHAIGPQIGASIGKALGKGKEIEKLEDELKYVTTQIADTTTSIAAATDPTTRATLVIILDRYKNQKREIEREIKKLS